MLARHVGACVLKACVLGARPFCRALIVVAGAIEFCVRPVSRPLYFCPNRDFSAWRRQARRTLARNVRISTTFCRSCFFVLPFHVSCENQTHAYFLSGDRVQEATAQELEDDPGAQARGHLASGRGNIVVTGNKTEG